MEVLWQDEIPEKAVALLHNMIYNIRKELSAYGMGTILIYEKKKYRIDMEGMACDFYQIKRIAELVERGNTAPLMAEYKSFLGYWGSYLEDIDNCWAQAKRGYYDEVYKKGCFMLAEQFAKENNPETAIKLYQNILSREPYSEKAVEKMLLLYGEQREWEKVMRCYVEFKEIMERDSGLRRGREFSGHTTVICCGVFDWPVERCTLRINAGKHWKIADTVWKKVAQRKIVNLLL